MNPQIQAADPSITQGEIARLRAMMMAMPLDQLQAYAAQHMNNPNGGIIVGIASQVANAKKGATPQTPPNSVAQQAVQSIAPESQGIGQLPARNLEGMADGGIAGYADGGNTDKDRYPTHEEAVAAFNAAYPTPKYNQPEQRGPISQAAHDLMVQFHLLPDDTPGAISPESQRASVYGTSQIGHAAGGVAGYAEGGQIGGRMDGGIRRFDVAGSVFDMAPDAVKQYAQRLLNMRNASEAFGGPKTPYGYTTPGAAPTTPSFLSNLGSVFKGASPLLGAVGLASVQTPEEDAILAKSDPKYAAYLQKNNPSRWEEIKNQFPTPAAPPNAPASGTASGFGDEPYPFGRAGGFGDEPTGPASAPNKKGITALVPKNTPGAPGANAVPAVDPKTKAPPKVDDAKKEGTVASNGLYSLLDNKGTAYQGLTLEDVNRSLKLAQDSAPSATDLYNQANDIAKEKDAAARAEYKPLQDLSDAEHKRLQNRNDNAFANALIMGSLAGMNSRNFGEFFEKAGKVGGESYIHDKDYADAAERELLKSDLATKQALDARLNNNERDAQTYMHLSDTRKQNAIANTMAAYGLTDQSQRGAATLDLQNRELGIKQLLAPAQLNALNAQAYAARGQGDYSRAMATALPSKQDTALFMQSQKLAQKDYEDWLRQQQSTGNAFNLTDDQLRAKQEEFLTRQLSKINKNPSASGTVAPAAAPNTSLWGQAQIVQGG